MEEKDQGNEVKNETVTEVEQEVQQEPAHTETEPKRKKKQSKNPNEITVKRKDWDSLNTKCEEYLDTAQRIKAEFDNYKKRNETVRSDSYNEGKASTALEFLAVLDNLERANETFAEADESLKTGMELILKQTKDVFAKLGVEEIPAEGEKFDPALHQAVMQTEKTDELESGFVSKVLMKGYRIGDKVLRYAMVAVVE
ncbi:MAG: nucleotide exchange factor GrpE [Clostridia bacterium]|nr:nucleotide exchange factor GrpE [Clostridia bacterium]